MKLLTNESLQPTAARLLVFQSRRVFQRPMHCGGLGPAALAEFWRSAETFHRFLRIGLHNIYDHD
jgi:hypothetical protein